MRKIVAISRIDPMQMLGDIFRGGVDVLINSDQPLYLWYCVRLARTRDANLIKDNKWFIAQLWQAVFHNYDFPNCALVSNDLRERPNELRNINRPAKELTSFRIALDIISHPLSFKRTSVWMKKFVDKVIAGEVVAGFEKGGDLKAILNLAWPVVNRHQFDKIIEAKDIRFMCQNTKEVDQTQFRSMVYPRKCNNWISTVIEECGPIYYDPEAPLIPIDEANDEGENDEWSDDYDCGVNVAIYDTFLAKEALDFHRISESCAYDDSSNAMIIDRFDVEVDIQ